LATQASGAWLRQAAMKRYVILISGRGSNMRALLDARLPGECAAVIGSRAQASGLELARARGIVTAYVEPGATGGREAFEQALIAEIDRHNPDLILLAGFMRILGHEFVRHYQGRMINIHPSLLPAFPGLKTHAQALASGVRIHGCTVHFVTPSLDAGPIVIQAAVPVLTGDSEMTLAARVLEQEHVIYPCAARWFLEGRLHLQDGSRVALAGDGESASVLISPDFS
jgi:phosphoribosylglycinamide formyltransferase-1